jgi:beta-lactamase class A
MSEKKSRSIVGLIFIGLGLLLFIIIIVGLYNQRNTAAISDQAYAPTDSTEQDSLSPERVNFARLKAFVHANQNAPIDTTGLDKQINDIIATNSDIVISVAIKDLNTGATHNYGNQDAMTAASVTKVLTAVDYLKEVELGHKSLDTVLNDGNTAKYDIEQMIVVSDNNAWHALNDSLTYTQMQAYAQSVGLSTYYYVDNTINTADITKLLSDLYQRHLINETNTQLLLSYMERANFRDLIIPAVPEHDSVYHKAGWLYSYLNDATIITNTDRAIVLTIFSDSITNYDKTRIAAIMQSITTPTLVTFKLN